MYKIANFRQGQKERGFTSVRASFFCNFERVADRVCGLSGTRSVE